ncbi:ras-related protein rab7-like isoform X1 [Frankliniella occidentalis]|uniref:Ras-related protein rab7-like isoform X1 n=1 Tax=Frankliniella occidentalis TaxID=133901 RepID=A0A6J1S811_FRAOC|nr:ras-related protein rab7-like isoform X1 [Frankliniella occidentalis]
MTSVEKVRVKVVPLGSSGVGKTSLAMKYTADVFSNMYISTVGQETQFKEIMVDDKVVKMEIHDTAGQERFRAVTRSLYRDVDCCVLVFDVTNRNSFESLDFWMNEFLLTRCPEVPADFPFVVLGNKCEMEQRLVTKKEAIRWCQEKYCNINYFDVSAKEDINLELAFQTVAKKALKLKSEEIKIQPTDVSQRVKLKDEGLNQSKQSWWSWWSWWKSRFSWC